VDQLSVDDVADAPLEGAQGFFGGLALGLFALVVDASGSVVGDLSERRGVDGMVELPVPSRVETMADLGSR
jgi:hypothetical protein